MLVSCGMQIKMAGAVFRVKRLLDEEPSNALVINCKRRKTDNSESVCEPLAAILNFAGTVNDQVRILLQDHIT